MTTLDTAQEAAIATPDPVFSSDGLAVKLYDGSLTLGLLPGCSADRDDDQPSIYGAFVPLTVELAKGHSQKSKYKPQCVRRCRLSLRR